MTLNNNGSVTTGYALAITHNGTDTSKDAADGTITVENGKFSGVVGIQEPSADQDDRSDNGYQKRPLHLCS